ncbi:MULTISPECIES: flagellar hook-associated protein FlgK [unclassified Variovorax]|uniref:flagellar hook-associated protein FlgK n=1 Tax=unclassified Variovorax TaxID=663243 RepID=UPI002578B85E|nr:MULTISPECIES: flagellar hook-associated protein FlgK [unclassified Variovorax]MDM0089762.1 flagellar hook-associated protein FlgK [Variovorax sp. J22G40]MDM0148572.1 flagellar hook-associated protein FlgK [Variovorax sp. J2P1-31]
MSSLLNIGTRALLANQVALSTTGHNVANANTVGYSRQSAVLQQVPGQYTGGGYIGSGVTVSTIERAHNEFLTRQAGLAQSVAAMDSTRADRLASLEDIFKGGASGLGASVSDMLNAFTDVASAPNDISARNVVLTRADEMASRFRNAQSQLDDLQRGVNAQLGDAVTSINSMAQRVAALNLQIARTTGGGQSPNDLLDQRDQLMRQLGQQVQVTTVDAGDGTLSVFVGSQALVLGTTAATMSLTIGDNGTRQLAMTRGTLTTPLDEATLGGGEVAGLLRFQNSDLVAARDSLGRMALAISSELNAQNQLGLDLDGHAGAAIFRAIAIPDASASTANTGNATLVASVNNASALVPSSYQVSFGSAGAIEVTRLSDGKRSSFSGPLPLQIDGLTFELNAGTPAAGDSFVIKPYANAAGGVAMAMTSPREIAAASPVEARPAAANTGSVSVASLAATSNNANQGATVTLTFAADGSYSVSGTGTGNPTGQPYVAGQPIAFNGWSLTLSGTPKAGDVITVQAATPGYSKLGAGNAGALAGLRDKAMFDGASMVDGYAGLMAQIGVRSQSAQYAADVSGSIAANLETERANGAGVNLDEEAAKLLQYQQAYQASAKMIQIAQTVFDSLLHGMA